MNIPGLALIICSNIMSWKVKYTVLVKYTVFWWKYIKDMVLYFEVMVGTVYFSGLYISRYRSVYFQRYDRIFSQTVYFTPQDRIFYLYLYLYSLAHNRLKFVYSKYKAGLWYYYPLILIFLKIPDPFLGFFSLGFTSSSSGPPVDTFILLSSCCLSVDAAFLKMPLLLRSWSWGSYRNRRLRFYCYSIHWLWCLANDSLKRSKSRFKPIRLSWYDRRLHVPCTHFDFSSPVSPP